MSGAGVEHRVVHSRVDFPMVHDQSAKIHPKTLQKLACHAVVDAIQIEKCGAGCLATLCGQGRLRRSSPRTQVGRAERVVCGRLPECHESHEHCHTRLHPGLAGEVAGRPRSSCVASAATPQDAPPGEKVPAYPFGSLP